jgi:hypothetical protein
MDHREGQVADQEALEAMHSTSTCATYHTGCHIMPRRRLQRCSHGSQRRRRAWQHIEWMGVTKFMQTGTANNRTDVHGSNASTCF